MTLSQLYYWLIIAFMVADFVIGLWLTALNIKASKWPVPKVLEGLYDDKKYRKQQAYSSENRRVGVIISSIGVVFSVCFFAFRGFAALFEEGTAGLHSDPERRSEAWQRRQREHRQAGVQLQPEH